VVVWSCPGRGLCALPVLVEPANYDAIPPFAARSCEGTRFKGEHAPNGLVRCPRGRAVVGIAVLMQVGSGYRLTGAWVDPVHRKRGVCIALNRHRIAIAEVRCGAFIESLSLHPGFFDANASPAKATRQTARSECGGYYEKLQRLLAAAASTGLAMGRSAVCGRHPVARGGL